MAKGPGYTIDDLIYYTGLFGGIIVTYLLLENLPIHHIIRLIIALVVGVGTGWCATYFFTRKENSGEDGEF
ncbi:hypothetical protein DTL21_21410 [Bremerella cremea]|uniref:Uncharacterized protein n=1 Tax=Blastopirellula marina TaxID=124 RepID=A0A2S8FKR3_9BACT|nr:MULTISPECIES: hypothetical protein [Pirellulaceae]PQO32747.1 hypothetical protein C5Y83_21390 [Blastopirellula marina]RCS45814.1 hypothetical protein DTL21_21410 [Bremerella cremea]